MKKRTAGMVILSAELAATTVMDGRQKEFAASRNPAIEHVLQFFKYDHLPEGKLRDASKCCADLAADLAAYLPSNPETTVGLRKLLEAKDCFVRAAMIGDVR